MFCRLRLVRQLKLCGYPLDTSRHSWADAWWKVELEWNSDAPQEEMAVLQMSRECFFGQGVVGLCGQLEHAAIMQHRF